MEKLKSHAYLEKCKHCNDVILDSEYEDSGPGHACNKLQTENIDHIFDSLVNCSNCSFFRPIEDDWGYCKLLPVGSDEVSKIYNQCKFKEYIMKENKNDNT